MSGVRVTSCFVPTLNLDLAAKTLMDTDPRPFVRWALPGRRILSVEGAPTELVLQRHMDRLLRARVAGEPEPVHVHFEIYASWASRIPRKVYRY